MKRFLGMTVAVTVLTAGAMAFAGGACCQGKADAAKTEKMMGCSSDKLAKLKLTDDQKKKVEALKEECTKEGCTPAMQEKFSKSMKDILTGDQFAEWQSECQKAAKGAGCPMMKKDESKI